MYQIVQALYLQFKYSSHQKLNAQVLHNHISTEPKLYICLQCFKAY